MFHVYDFLVLDIACFLVPVFSLALCCLLVDRLTLCLTLTTPFGLSFWYLYLDLNYTEFLYFVRHPASTFIPDIYYYNF